jgi:Spy/CpxP family protein refolding chaperone
MSKGPVVLAGLALLGALSAPLLADAKGKGRDKAKKGANANKARKPKREGSAPKAAAFGEDLSAVARKVDLTDEQQDRIRRLKQSRDQALAKHDSTWEPKLQKANARLSQLTGGGGRQAQGARRQLEGFVEGAAAAREQIEASYEKKMFAVLTPEQRAKWNLPVLLDALTSEFSLLFLTSRQEERLRGFCEAQAKRLPVPLDPQKHAKLIESLKAQVYRTILTDKQRSEYAKIAAARRKDGAGEGKKGRNKGRNKGRGKNRNKGRGGKNNSGKAKAGIVGGGRAIGQGGSGVVGKGAKRK